MSASYGIERWGKDHWSTLAYVAHWCAEYGQQGFDIASLRHSMRCDADLHPQFAPALRQVGKYPTRLKGGEEASGHDDWSCLDDLEAAALIERKGTGIAPLVFITEAGLALAAQLNRHKSRGGNFGDFVP